MSGRIAVTVIAFKTIDNLFGPRLSPMSQVQSVTYVSGSDPLKMVPAEGLEPPTP